MNNHLYIQVNENTDITSGQWSDGSVFIAINQKDKTYHIYDINNSKDVLDIIDQIYNPKKYIF